MADDMQELNPIDQFALHERCLQEGICPRGCGPLEVLDIELLLPGSPEGKIRKCPVCTFTHFAANPRQPHAACRWSPDR